MTEPGAVVLCTALDSRPHMLVLAAQGSTLRTALLADLASETIQRLGRGHSDTVGEADDIDSYRVPCDDVAPSPAFGGER